MTDAIYYLNILSGARGAALESTESDIELSKARMANSIEALKLQIDAADTKALDVDLIHALVASATSGMRKLSSEGPDSSLTKHEILGLEAVILTDGSRPAMFVQDNSIQLQQSVLDQWHADVQMHHPRISIVTRSVGRIDDPAASQKFSGTGFVIDPGVIVTNRHVLEAIADEQPGHNGESSWTLHDNVEINFSHEFERAVGTGYSITDVLYAGPTPINHEVDFERLDMAILQCDTDADFPPKVELAEPSSSIDIDSKIYVIGYPARPRFEDSNVLTDIFSNTFGYKRWAPGKIKVGAGDLDGDDNAWITSHDASTLGGNSGSAVFLLEGSGDVCVGLHFAGVARKQNYAHVIAKIRTELGIR